VRGAIDVTWEARVRFGEEVVTLHSQPASPAAEPAAAKCSPGTGWSVDEK
jgi:hypothetical protein